MLPSKFLRRRALFPHRDGRRQHHFASPPIARLRQRRYHPDQIKSSLSSFGAISRQSSSPFVFLDARGLAVGPPQVRDQRRSHRFRQRNLGLKGGRAEDLCRLG
ncbi:hypothetical protein L484_025810 [Morus notabilis]|uniref:Uncharacterized protein n=1 Tax=Morus notabilis TaxID=981085 RepID=W9R457_9ROSA|nr:hypothetical protein L484_025810 [Morus notabilis]